MKVLFKKKLDDPSLLSIIWMVKIQYWFGFNPYEKWWSSSVGIMKFPVYMESHKIPWFQSTNQL